jgi:hypothetical protein
MLPRESNRRSGMRMAWTHEQEVAQLARCVCRKRYDRQLRLWGEHGQQAMEDCSICLINGSATGTETLKNLVLPGDPVCSL